MSVFCLCAVFQIVTMLENLYPILVRQQIDWRQQEIKCAHIEMQKLKINSKDNTHVASNTE